MSNVYKKALEKWGAEAQLGMLQEECAEAIVAASKVMRRKPGAVDSLCEEIADVEIMCDQMREFLVARTSTR